MKECVISVQAAVNGVVIWCATCTESVAWAEWFTDKEVAATAQGHRVVMARANVLRKAHERKK